MFDAYKAPANWDEWSDRVSAELWEAVALMHDIEPAKLPVDWRPADYSDPFEHWPHLARDIRIAADHAATGRLKYISFSQNSAQHKVDLTVFAEWAESLGRNLPPHFPRLTTLSRGRRPIISADILRQWYTKTYIPQCNAAGSNPSESADFSAAQAKFGAKVRRQQIRDLREEFAPDHWKKQGRRRSAGNSAAS